MMQTREELYRYLDYHAYEAEAGWVVCEGEGIRRSGVCIYVEQYE